MGLKSANLRTGFALLVAMLLLSACGGGGGGGDSAAPSGPNALATDPPDTAVGASLTRALGVTFSTPVNAATVNIGSFTLTGPAGPVNGTVTVVGPTAATFTPTNALAFNSDYTARLTTAIKDTAGNPLAADYIWRFNTGKKIAVGGGHTCARLDNGQMKCWGNNGAGQLGLGDNSGNNLGIGDQANEMGNNLPAVDLGSGRTAVQLAAGDSHTCARLDNSQVKCWGNNNSGQLGLGNNAGDRGQVGDQPNEMGNDLPAVELGSDRRALEIVAGRFHTCARLDSGQVKCWGRNVLGELGLGDNAGDRIQVGDQVNEMGDNLPAVDLGNGRTVLGLVVGASHTCARLDNGQVKCWGNNGAGQLGLGDITGNKIAIGDQANEMGNNLPAVDLGSGRSALELVGGTSYTCARLDNGRVKCWGGNAAGQLGLGDIDTRGDQANEMGDMLQAVNLGTVSFNNSPTVLELAVGGAHTCVRYIDSFIAGPARIKCWGQNVFGQIGRGDNSGNNLNIGDQASEMGNDLPAVDLGSAGFPLGDRSVLEVVAGRGGHTCAHLDNGQVKCWGLNDSGQLGRGDTDNWGDGPNEMGDNLPAVDLGS